MILDVKMLKEEDNIRIELGDDRYEIVDTIEDWIVRDSNGVSVGVFNKFSTISILLHDKDSEY